MNKLLNSMQSVVSFTCAFSSGEWTLFLDVAGRPRPRPRVLLFLTRPLLAFGSDSEFSKFEFLKLLWFSALTVSSIFTNTTSVSSSVIPNNPSMQSREPYVKLVLHRLVSASVRACLTFSSSLRDKPMFYTPATCEYKYKYSNWGFIDILSVNPKIFYQDWWYSYSLRVHSCTAFAIVFCFLCR